MNTFALTILAYNAVLFQGEARSCRVSTSHGSLGLEARHEPLLAVLRDGSDVAVTDAQGKTHTIPVATGLLSFRQNACTITVERRAGASSTQPKQAPREA
jgi:F0F1-type ATP synthase epsilon subunit